MYNSNKMTLKDYYNNLPSTPIDPKSKFKSLVKSRCKISDKTFYNWLAKPETIPDWCLAIIEDIQNQIEPKSTVSC
jgi:hypothetical protein